MTCAREFAAHRSPVSALAVSSDGELLTAGARGDGEVRHYRWTPVAGVDQEYEEGEPKHLGGAYVRVDAPAEHQLERPAHPRGVVAVVLSADERFAYSAGADPEEPIVQWSLATARRRRASTRRTAARPPPCMLPDGVGGAGRRRAPAATRRRQRWARGGGGEGGRLITAGADGALCVWAVDAVDPVGGRRSPRATRRRATPSPQGSAGAGAPPRRAPELSRAAWAVKARKELPASSARSSP